MLMVAYSLLDLAWFVVVVGITIACCVFLFVLEKVEVIVFYVGFMALVYTKVLLNLSSFEYTRGVV